MGTGDGTDLVSSADCEGHPHSLRAARCALRAALSGSVLAVSSDGYNGQRDAEGQADHAQKEFRSWGCLLAGRSRRQGRGPVLVQHGSVSAGCEETAAAALALCEPEGKEGQAWDEDRCEQQG
jgi:hypothetical protein